jgi:hypothetical protein
VIDSTATLFAFDAQGNAMSHVSLPTPIGALNGGGIGLALGTLYVSIGQPANGISAFDSASLAPQMLPAGAFPGLSVPRGVAYDSDTGLLFVGNAAADVNVYDTTGTPAAPNGSPFPGHYGPSGIAYDPDDHTIWVANYVGAAPATPPRFGVTEYTKSGQSAQTFAYGSQFASPASPTEPYSIAVCPSSATGGGTLVLVGFIDDGSGSGTRSVQAYSTSGAPVGAPFEGPLANPYSISCGPTGQVYVADRSGLYVGTATSAGLTGLGSPAQGFAGLTPPLFGVLVTAGSGSADGGESDATIEDGGGDAASNADATEAGTQEAGSDGPASSEGGDASAAAEAGEAGAMSDGGDAGDAGVNVACTLPTAGANGGPVQIGSGEECTLPSQVTSSTTITASPCGVYDAPDGILVSGAGTVLTVEQGVTIAFGPNALLQVTPGADIVVDAGTQPGPCAPVVFTSDSPTPTAGAWGQVLLQGLSPVSSISNLIVQYAGSTAPVTSWSGNVSFALDGQHGDFVVPLWNVTLSNNGSPPFYCYGNHTGPATGSGAITVTDWPAGTDPFTIFVDAAGMLSNVHLSTGGRPGGTVHLTSPGSFQTIDTTQTWPSIVPLTYVLAEPGDAPLFITSDGTTQPDGGPAGPAVLTIATPNTFHVGSGFQLEVDNGCNGNGVIVANGSPDAGVLFAPLPDAGPWGGVRMNYPGWASSSLSYVTFDSAGGQGEPCSDPNLGRDPTGALFLFWVGGEMGGVVTDCAPAPPAMSNLSFPHLAGDFGILPYSVEASEVDAIVTANPNATVYNCGVNQCH